jgi:hypothetical protein
MNGLLLLLISKLIVAKYVFNALNDPQNNIHTMRLLVPLESEYRNMFNNDYQEYINEKYIKGNIFIFSSQNTS